MSNPRILAVFHSSKFIAPKEFYQDIFSPQRLNRLFGQAEQTVLIGTSAEVPEVWAELGIQTIATDNESTFIAEAVDRLNALSNNFSLNHELDGFIDKWATGSADEKSRQEFKADLRRRAPMLIYYPAMPLLVLPDQEEALIKRHIDYLADATFFDNSPEALTPMVLAPWFIGQVTPEALGTQSIRAYLLKNLNHIDAELDYLRPDLSLFRLDFSAQSQAALDLRRQLQSARQPLPVNAGQDLSATQPESGDSFSYQQLAEVVNGQGVGLRTTPHYFEIEITNQCGFGCIFCPRQYTENNRGEMAPALFAKIVKEVADLAGTQKTICLGGMGEPLEHSQWPQLQASLIEHQAGYDKLFIETNGAHLTWELVEPLLNALGAKLTVIINLSSLNTDNYTELYKPSSGPQTLAGVLENLKRAAQKAGETGLNVEDIFVVQQLKINEVADEIDSLRNFFRPKENSTLADTFIDDPKLRPGVLLQKYNRYRDLMPERRVSDLTPLERGFCWHLARDMYILADGRYAFCKQDVAAPLSDISLQEETILGAWQRRAGHFEKNFKGDLSAKHNCLECDEWFTFNG